MKAVQGKTAVKMHLSHEFLFSKAHGRWAASFHSDEMERLLRSGDLEALKRALANIGISTEHRANIQRDLTQHLIREVSVLKELATETIADFYGRFIEYFFIENLKTILHYRYFPQQDQDVRQLLVVSPHLPMLHAHSLLEARSVHEFFQRLPTHPLKDDLLPLLVEVDDTHDLFAAESRLDVLYYRWLLQALAKGSSRQSPFERTAKELVTMEIEIANLVMLLRNVAVYHLDETLIEELSIPGGTDMTAARMKQLATGTERHATVAQLPALYRRVLEPLQNEPLYRSENRLWTLLYDKAEAAFRDFNHPPRSLAAFPYLKRTETLNLGRLFEGLYLRLNPVTIRTMLIGM